MPENKRITEANIIFRGFVGGYIDRKPTLKGRPRTKFDFYAGDTDLAKLQVPFIAHCVSYDNLAEDLSDTHRGDYLILKGYLRPHILKDYSGKPVFIEFEGKTRPVYDHPTLMIQSWERLKHDPVNPHLFE